MTGPGAAGPCPGCAGFAIGARLDLGRQPLCNRFLTPGTREGEYTHALALGQCPRCGLVRILEPVPVPELQPRFGWISYREPEEHLDRLVETLANFPGFDAETVIGGVSYKDDSTLARFAARGQRRTWRVDAVADLGLSSPRAEIESVQDRLRPAAARSVLRRHPPADLLLARHILEHVADVPRFLGAARALLRPGGRLVVESPDCLRAFRLGDYTSVWEEHLLYFTPATFRSLLALRGFEPLEILRFPYPFEDSLVAVAVAAAQERTEQAAFTADDFSGDVAAFAAFAGGLARRAAQVRALLARPSVSGRRVALLGAGHAACMFINLLELADLIDFVADDSPDKAGLSMPGSRLPILPSTALLDRGVELCLLAVGASAEERVVQRHRELIARGGRFASIYPASPLALVA